MDDHSLSNTSKAYSPIYTPGVVRVLNIPLLVFVHSLGAPRDTMLLLLSRSLCLLGRRLLLFLLLVLLLLLLCSCSLHLLVHLV